MSTIRGVILDYGEVICRRPAPGHTERMAEAAGIDAETFRIRYNRERDGYDRGDVTPAEYWSAVLGRDVASDSGFLDSLRRWDVEMWSVIDGEMTGWLQQLRSSGIRTALLSNMHYDMAVHARRSYPWLKHLDCVILSSEVRLIKPGRAIYERCLEDFGLPASQVCFIDDREVNVRAAINAGIAAVRFRTIGELREELTRLGLSVLPGSQCCGSHPRI